MLFEHDMIGSSVTIRICIFLSLLFTGRLALKLVERKESLVLKSRVIAMTYFAILWTAEPLHSIVDEHMLGRKLG